MLEQGRQLKKARGPTLPLPALGVIVLLGAAAGGFFWWLSTQAPAEEPQLTEEARAYLPHLALSDVEMKAEEDFLEQTVVAIEGKITNTGERRVSLVEVNCVFRDVNGIEIGRERGVLIGRRTGALAAGETKSFRLAFDAVPLEWNQAMPSLFISQIQFE